MSASGALLLTPPKSSVPWTLAIKVAKINFSVTLGRIDLIGKQEKGYTITILVLKKHHLGGLATYPHQGALCPLDPYQGMLPLYP